MPREYNSEGVPLDELFMNKEMRRLRFQKWWAERHPDGPIDEEGKAFMKLVRRREALAKLMKK